MEPTRVGLREWIAPKAFSAPAQVTPAHNGWGHIMPNHPSGDPMPSADDALLTQRLPAAGELLGIPVLDDIVIGDGRFYSFNEAARL